MFGIWAAGLFYTLPVVQLVFYHQNTMVTTGNQVTGSSNNYTVQYRQIINFCCFLPKLYVQNKIPTVSGNVWPNRISHFLNFTAFSNC
jgi:hypothetical protein